MLYVMYEGQSPDCHTYRISDVGPSDVVKMESNFHVKSKLKGSYRVGQIYEMEGEFNDEGGISYKRYTVKWIKAHPDASSFSIAHNANAAYIQAKNKAENYNLRHDLRNIRLAYKNARGQQRNVILALVIQAVTS